MKATVLFAAPESKEAASVLRSTVTSALAARGYLVRTFALDALSLAFCQGDFDCWTKTPGACRIHDDEQSIEMAVHDSNAVVFVGPITFGGHGAVLKRAIDRLISLVSPMFTTRAELTHHVPRYDHYPSLFAVGWTPHAGHEERASFHELLEANAINLLAPTCGCAVLDDRARDAWPGELATMFMHAHAPGAGIDERGALRAELLGAAIAPPLATHLAPKRAAVLIGSAKPRGASASEHLAQALVDRLPGVVCEFHPATAFAHEQSGRAAAAAIACADLFILASPLYVDALPSLATRGLEMIADARTRNHHPAHLAAILNCGFPEPEQLRTAVSIVRQFAAAAGYEYTGTLPLGGGGVVTPQRDLSRPHGPTAHITRALDLAGPALLAGTALPIAAIEAMAEAAMPDAIYRLAGNLGFRWQALKNRVALAARPLDRHS